ncbi:hypothetical protein ACNRWW_07485 [Metabacillus sp. HB246100]
MRPTGLAEEAQLQSSSFFFAESKWMQRNGTYLFFHYNINKEQRVKR